jgi:hypothetical protein
MPRHNNCGKHERSPESRARLVASLKRYWSDPENRRRQSELTKARMARPGVSEKISERTAAALADPIVKARQIQALKTRFADPLLRAKISAATEIGMAQWRWGRIAAAATVLRQLPDADREQALALLIAAARAGWRK